MKLNTAITPKVMNEYQPGAILEDSWGWEQTNIDFYCIVARKGDWITVLPMKQASSPEVGFMTNYKMPTVIDWDAKPARKKICKSRESHQFGKELGFSFRNYTGGGWCRLWDGKPSLATHYA